MNLDGVLVVDKPAGMTSHDVVAAIRRRFATRKVGHAGSLDPDATGLLVLGLGRATRLMTYAQQTPKRYRAVARFGTTTTTQDASGDVVEERPAAIGAADVSAALPAFTGTISQIPPMVSAVKVGGERLYAKARRGEEVERAVRSVTVYELELVDFTGGDRPQATFDVSCSAGTYVRTVVHDLGEKLGCGAHLAHLRRTETAGFTEADAVALEDAAPEHVRSPLEAVRGLDRLEVDEAAAETVSHGGALPAPGDATAADRVAIVRGDRLLAVYRRRGGRLIPERVLAAS